MINDAVFEQLKQAMCDKDSLKKRGTTTCEGRD